MLEMGKESHGKKGMDVAGEGEKGEMRHDEEGQKQERWAFAEHGWQGLFALFGLAGPIIVEPTVCIL